MAYLLREFNMSKKEKQTMPMASNVDRIITLRGVRVMLDRDLSDLYGVETRVLKQAVRRNIDRFPSDFMFELTDTEFENWRSQFVTSKSDMMGLRYKPMVFTEQGVTMLSSVLRSQRAIRVNIQIMRAFIELCQMYISHEGLKRNISAMEKKYDQQFQIVFKAIKLLLGEDGKPGKKIGYIKECLSIYDKPI